MAVLAVRQFDNSSIIDAIGMVLYKWCFSGADPGFF